MSLLKPRVSPSEAYPEDPREKTPPPFYLTPFLLALLPFLIAITHFNMLNMHLVLSASFHQNGQPQRQGLRLFMPSPQEACNKHLLREGIHKAVLSMPAILLLGYSTAKGCINSYCWTEEHSNPNLYFSNNHYWIHNTLIPQILISFYFSTLYWETEKKNLKSFQKCQITLTFSHCNFDEIFFFQYHLRSAQISAPCYKLP